MRVWCWKASALRTSSLLLLLLLPFAAQSQLSAGVARVSITPDPTAERVPLGGYTARGAKKATGVRDSVNATALVLHCGGARFAMVSCDLLTVPKSLKDAVLARMPDWQPRELLIAATHTHCAPDSQRLNERMKIAVPGIATFDARALAWTADRIAQAVTKAGEDLKPVILRLGEKEANLSRMRRGKESAPPAPDVLRVAELREPNGAPVALVVNYAAHPTIFGDKMLQVSAEWPGEVARLWERENPGGMLLFFNGAQGDRSPIADDGWKAAPTDEERMRLYARRVEIVVERAQADATPSVVRAIEVLYGEAALPKPLAHPELVADLKKSGIPLGLLETALKGFVPTQAPCMIVKIGGWALLAAPGEPSTSVGSRLRALLPGSWLVGLANEWVGYILTAEQYAAGGYEATVSFSGPSLADTVFRGFATLVKR